VARRWLWALPLLGFVLGAAAFRPLRREASALALLGRLAAPIEERTRAVPFRDLTLGEDGRRFRARLYTPGEPAHRCIVLGHGVHYLAIDEPRLVRFAKELARSGAAVLTPELDEIADYHVTRTGADVLADATRFMARTCTRVADGKVGLVGFSFAGGLALLAAERADLQAQLAYVASVGGYDDLERVLRFFLTNQVQTLHGPEPRVAHEYGLIVLMYQYIGELVPEGDYAVMRSAVRAWLHEDRKGAWAIASARTTAEGEALFVHVTRGEGLAYRGALESIVAKKHLELGALSPTGHLATLPLPVYLLHGTGDRVIPPEEAWFADRELKERSHVTLVTPLLEHVELGSMKSLADGAKLVDFMSRLL
jgi:pimeloyl-ACP methyl ester carboxylesterase